MALFILLLCNNILPVFSNINKYEVNRTEGRGCSSAGTVSVMVPHSLADEAKTSDSVSVSLRG